MYRVFLLYGEDLPLVYSNLEKIEHNIKEKEPFVQFHHFSEVTMQEIITFLDSGSLFGETFCIKVKKIKGSLQIGYWEQSPHYLIIHSDDEKDPYPKENSKILEKIPGNLPKPWDLLKVIDRSFGNISPSAAHYLSHTLQSIKEIEEIKKQMLFYNITSLDLESLSLFLASEDVSSFTLAEYFFQPEKASLFIHGVQALLKRGLSLDPLLNSLLKRTKDIIEIKKGLLEKKTLQSIAKDMKLHSFIVEKMLPTVSLYTPRILKDLIVRIVETQFLSRFYSSQLDLMLITRLFFEQKEFSYLR